MHRQCFFVSRAYQNEHYSFITVILLLEVKILLFSYKNQNRPQMQHSIDDLVDLFFEKQHNKEPTEIANFVSLAFGNPHILLDKLLSVKSQASSQNQSGLDLKLIFKMYENITLMNLDNQVIIQINKVYDAIAGEAQFKTFLKSSKEVKYFFVILLWKKLFTEPLNKATLLRTMNLIKRAQYYNNIFISCLGDIPEEYFRIIVQSSNNILGMTLNTYLQDQNQQNQKQYAHQTELICNFMQHLYLSNKAKPRLPLHSFNNKFIMENMEPVEQFKLYLKKAQFFNFVNYPFLLGFDYKYKIMQIESIYEQKMNIRKKMENGFTSILHQVDFNHQFNLDGLIYLYLNVRRNHILDDSMEKLGKVKENLKSPLKISFIGEEGADQGGVKNQYFQAVTKAIFNPYLDMFLPKNHGRFYWFNSYSFEPPIRFEFVGILLALSLYNSVHLDIHFPDITFKKLLSKTYEEEPCIQMINDLSQIEPDIHRTLKNIMTSSENVEELELYFIIQLQSFGEKYIEELVEDGASIKLTNDNREFYCMMYADYILNKSVSKQFTAFKRGFERVVSGGIIDTFEPEELRVLIGGIEAINFTQLEETTQYEGGYTKDTPVVRYFWETIHALNQQEQKRFLTFVTGTDRVPIEGLKSLNFLIQKHGDPSKLPSAHTCFNVFLLPEYPTKEELQKKLRIILEHNQGFGLI